VDEPDPLRPAVHPPVIAPELRSGRFPRHARSPRIKLGDTSGHADGYTSTPKRKSPQRRLQPVEVVLSQLS
jgi:hypothetical protein